MKLTAKISWSIFAVAFLSAATGSTCVYLLARNSLRHEIEGHLASVAQSRATHIQTYLDMLKISAGQFSKSIVLEDLLKAAESENLRQTREYDVATIRLRRTIAANPFILEFLLLDNTGRVLISTDEKSVGADKSSDAIFLGAQRNVYLKDVYYLPSLKQHLLTVSAPVTDRQTGAFLGVLVARVSLSELNSICTRREGLGETGEIYLVNKYGLMITPSRFDPDYVFKRKVDTENTRLAQQHSSSDPGAVKGHGLVTFPDYRGETVIGMHGYLPEMKWLVLAEMDAKEALAPLSTMRLIFIAVLLAVPFLAWLLGRFVAGTITRSLIKLHQGTEIVGAGNLDYKVGTGARDEAGQLAQAFDAMTARLKTTLTSVANLNREIAERKRAEAALRASEEDLAITLRSIGDAVIATDPQGRVTRINPTAEQLTGWPLTEAAGRPLGDVFRIVNTLTRAPAIDPVQQAIAKGEVIGLANHTSLIARDGAEYQIADSAAPIRNATGHIRGVVLVFHDISAEYKIREALRRSEEQLKTVFDSVRTGIAVIDGNDLSILEINQAVCELIGLPRSEIVGKTCHRFICPAEVGKCPIKNLGQQVDNSERVLLASAGRAIPILNTVVPINFQGKACYLESFVDITARKQAEEAVRKAKVAWENTFDSVPDLIALLDDQHTITRVNRATAGLLGTDPGELVGKKCYACIHGTDAPPGNCPHQRLLDDGQEHQTEIFEKRFNKWLQLTVSPLRNDRAQIIGAVHIARDITERKAAEEALTKSKAELEKANARLEQELELESKLMAQAQDASAAKSQFIANISHEIRTPLNGILGIGELLQETRLDAVQKEYVQIINASAEFLLNIINATLDLSKIVAGKFELEKTPFNLRSIFEDIVGVLAVNAARKNLELTGFIDPAAPLGLIGDASRLRQVLFNLIGNAIKFTSAGEIAVFAAPVEENPAGFTCASRCATPASAFPPTNRTGCSSRSPRLTILSRANSEAPAWGWRSPKVWSSRWAARSASTAFPAGARVSGS
jgi:PAS domain S-box-containing protein